MFEIDLNSQSTTKIKLNTTFIRNILFLFKSTEILTTIMQHIKAKRRHCSQQSPIHADQIIHFYWLNYKQHNLYSGRTHMQQKYSMITTILSIYMEMLPSACGLAQHFQDLGHSFSLYGPTLRRTKTCLSFFLAVNWLTSGFVYATLSLNWLTGRTQTNPKKI